MTVLLFKPRQAPEQIAPPKPVRGRLELVQVPLESGLTYSVEDSVRGRLSVGNHTIESLDGHVLGMAAFVANVGSVTVTAPCLAGISVLLSGSRKEPPELAALRRTLESLEESGQTKEMWAEYWFMKRLQVVLRGAWNSKREHLALLEGWERSTLPTALDLVPAELHVHQRFARAPGYSEKGEPLTGASIASAARNHRFIKAFQEEGHAYGFDIPWELVSRMEDPHGPVAINGAAYLAVQRMLRRWLFPRMPTSWAELSAAYEFCCDVERATVAPFGGEVDQEWVKSHCAARRELFPEAETAELFEMCVAGDMAALEAMQQSRDWLVCLSAQFIDLPTDAADER